MKVYDFSARLIDGKTQKLSDYEGKVLLIVNTASKCGFTPQYKGLQGLYAKFKKRGFELLAFPCDQFGHQEPGTNREILSFCEANFGIEFPLFAKIEVNGEGAHPLFQYLKSQKSGLLGGSIKWNFTKFLVNREGHVVHRYAPIIRPERIAGAIEKELARKVAGHAAPPAGGGKRLGIAGPHR
jgi:glutathione peroxidase